MVHSTFGEWLTFIWNGKSLHDALDQSLSQEKHQTLRNRQNLEAITSYIDKHYRHKFPPGPPTTYSNTELAQSILHTPILVDLGLVQVGDDIGTINDASVSKRHSA